MLNRNFQLIENEKMIDASKHSSYVSQDKLLEFSAKPFCGQKDNVIDSCTVSGPATVSIAGSNSQDNNGNEGGDDSQTGIATKTKTKTKKPSMYRVLLLNDDFTPMEFVVLILERFFRKTGDEATQIMLHVHNNGVGECGVFTYEVAETKVTQVMDFARKKQHPLQCILEKQ